MTIYIIDDFIESVANMALSLLKYKKIYNKNNKISIIQINSDKSPINDDDVKKTFIQRAQYAMNDFEQNSFDEGDIDTIEFKACNIPQDTCYNNIEDSKQKIFGILSDPEKVILLDLILLLNEDPKRIKKEKVLSHFIYDSYYDKCLCYSNYTTQPFVRDWLMRIQGEYDEEPIILERQALGETAYFEKSVIDKIYNNH